ncbi:hypothetical protein M0R45_036520 [Rubus argutus]|uniref:KIB1-4 beta-propeller domain-containing protein n=1 Tax=Rubus argutus TaxID=59490 RepID=A0AAW1W1H8_RUBAR
MKIRGVYKMLYMDDKVLDMQLPFVRPGKDTTWMYVDERWRGNEEAVHVKDKVYAVNNRSQLLSFKIIRIRAQFKGEWDEKKTLGGIALYVGDNSSVSILASKFSKCQSNYIYFNHDNNRIKSDNGPFGPYDFGVYNVESQKISKPYTTHATTLLKMTKRPPIWVMPTFKL